ncbi:MAG: FHA domain-containing protein [Magnetococcales bacterium]|nr:FHA domain-containing protein [Magnetococcales bacterium]
MRETVQLAIMFADIAGSTKLYETIGDTKAREITSRCIELMKSITVNHDGRVVKTIGDEVMCTFSAADNAAEASVEMQEEVAAHGLRWGTHLKIRVGFHFGEVIRENDDVFGDAVNLAARMAAQAKGDQIITTGETLECMSYHLRVNSRILTTTTVKGKSKPIQIVELTWGEEEELTVMGGPALAVPVMSGPSMVVSFGEQSVQLSESHAVVSFGRGSTNTFVVPDSMSSRVHARIEYRRGQIYLVDQSTNGTYVQMSDGQPAILVHREERPIDGSGVIGLGRVVTPDDPLAVHFQP